MKIAEINKIDNKYSLEKIMKSIYAQPIHKHWDILCSVPGM